MVSYTDLYISPPPEAVGISIEINTSFGLGLVTVAPLKCRVEMSVKDSTLIPLEDTPLEEIETVISPSPVSVTFAPTKLIIVTPEATTVPSSSTINVVDVPLGLTPPFSRTCIL